MNEKTLVTGASGWFGRSFLSEYIKKYGILALNNLILVTSDGRSIRHPLVKHDLPTITLDQATEIKDFRAIIQAGFPTRDKIEILGEHDYSLTCEKIIETLSKILGENKHTKIFLISSGAIYSDNSLYGEYKRLEEKSVRLKTGNNIFIFRVFAATTRFMDYRSWSAFCYFMRCKMTGNNILIQSKHDVLRGIVCMEDLSRLIISLSESMEGRRKTTITCDAISDIVSIREIANMFEAPLTKIILPDNYDMSKRDRGYTGNPNTFKELASRHQISLKSYEAQVENTLQTFFKKSFSLN